MNPHKFNFEKLTSEEKTLISETLQKGGLAILPSDTIYGVFASAFDEVAVEKVYTLKTRNEKKPLIVHISSIDEIKKFNIRITEKIEQFLSRIWPGPFSVILPCIDFEYLHRGSGGLAFRLIKYRPLLEILRLTGPLIGTSANPEGLKPAENIEEAEKYFSNNIDVYLDTGHLPPVPSTVIDIKDGRVKIIRQGAGKLPSNGQRIAF